MTEETPMTETPTKDQLVAGIYSALLGAYEACASTCDAGDKEGDGERYVRMPLREYEKLSDRLDDLEDWPNEPGYVCGPAASAKYALEQALARPAPAEGAVREAALREAAGIAYRMPAYVDNFNETDSMGRMLPGSPYDRGRYDASNEILAALSSPEDATPAAPVSVEEADTVTVPRELLIQVLMEAADNSNAVKAELPLSKAESESFADEQRRIEKLQAIIAQQDRRAALREMQSIREEMEQESGA